MASIGKLIQAIAAVEGLDESSVKLISRYAREGGHLSQGSTGAGAARMTPTDAANLLIGVNASSLAKDAVTAIEAYRPLVWKSDEKVAEVEATREDPFRSVFRTGVTIAEVLEKLILMAVPMFRPTSELEEALDREGLQIEIEFVRPSPAVHLRIYADHPPEHEDDIGEYHEAEAGVFASEQPLTPPAYDRTDRVRITHRTILEVGRVLAS